MRQTAASLLASGATNPDGEVPKKKSRAHHGGLASRQKFLLFYELTRRALLGANPMSRANEFRKDADEGRQQAEKSINLLEKERWLKIAEHWLQMAQEAEADPNTASGR
jgi:hypothetical protein